MKSLFDQNYQRGGPRPGQGQPQINGVARPGGPQSGPGQDPGSENICSLI